MKFTIAVTCLLLVYGCLYCHCVNGNRRTVQRHRGQHDLTVHRRVVADAVKSAVGSPEDEQIAQTYLTSAGLAIPATGVDGDIWIELCSVKARVSSTSLETTHDVKRCTRTVGGEILETRVVETEDNYSCGWRNEVYASGTLLTYKQTIINKYKSAISAALKAKESETVINLLQEKENAHVFNLEVATNKDTAMLEATATGLSWWGGGGSCAVKLEGRVLRLAY